MARAAEKNDSAFIHPVERAYPLVAVTVVDGENPSDEDWAKAFPGEGFFAAGVMEPESDRAVFRMLEGKDRLYVRIEAPSGGTDERKKNSVEFYVTQFGKPDFPCIAVTMKEDGENIIGLVRRARTWWNGPEVFPLDETTIPREITTTENGWRLEFSLPFDELDIPREGFLFNVAHGIGLVGPRGRRYAWCDLGGRLSCTSNQFNVYAHSVSAEKEEFPPNGLNLPAQLSVGINRLSLKHPDPNACLWVKDDILQSKDGIFEVPVRERGPLDLHLTDKNGNLIEAYHADVCRPLIINAVERYLPADAKEFDLDVAFDVAGDKTADVIFTCRRGNGVPEEAKVSLAPGVHTVKLPVPAGEGYEVRVAAKATVPMMLNAQPIVLDSQHWFAVGASEEDLAIYREGIRDLPTNRLCWAIIADAMPGLLQSQLGDGRYGGRPAGRPGELWDQMCVYVPALLYKTDHPDNPYFGDKRLLDSAIMGMEYALRPEARSNERGYPDTTRQGYLLTYELLKDDIDPELSAYWARELQGLVEGEVGRFLRNIVDKYTFYSMDCDTSTNDMAYHVPSLYLAGRFFDRADWRELSIKLIHRLARHGRDGYFMEQTGSPVNHYTWMTANALSEYYERSGDPEVLPTLEACAQYMTAITTAQGQVMALHDSRNSHHRATGCGEYVLSLTSEGRRAARAVILGRMGDTPAFMRGRSLYRMAENAVYFHPGEEADVFSTDSELPFPYGILVRKDGFQYGLSTITRSAVSGNYLLDGQNVIEMFHRDAGCILNGGNSQAQPEAGNFWRKLDEPDWEGKTVATSNDYLPTISTIAAIPGGHELMLGYRTFGANVVTRVLSPTSARVEAFASCDEGPVTFSFFPGVSEGEEIFVDPDGCTLRFRQVTFHANMPFEVNKDFRLLNPYNMQYQYTHKPVRCCVELKSDDRFILDITVADE